MKYFYNDGEDEVGPYSLDRLKALFDAGLIAKGTLVRAANTSEWKTVGDFVELGSEETPRKAGQSVEENDVFRRDAPKNVQRQDKPVLASASTTHKKDAEPYTNKKQAPNQEERDPAYKYIPRDKGMNTDRNEQKNPTGKTNDPAYKYIPKSRIAPSRQALDNTAASKQPGTGKYIVAWLLTGLISTMLGLPIDFFLAGALFSTSNFETSPYWMLSPICASVVWLAVAIAVYSLFSSLKIGSVMPWLWGLGALGLLVNIGRTFIDLSQYGLVPPSYYPVVAIATTVLAILAFGSYFRTHQPERY